MPAPPELGDRAGRVGIVEVLEEIDAEELGQPDGHVRISREIEVDLQRVAGDPQPGQAEVQLAAGQGKDGIGRDRDGVGHEHLLGQPDDEPPDSLGESRGRDDPVRDLPGDVAVANNRPGDRVRKQASCRGRSRAACPLESCGGGYR